MITKELYDVLGENRVILLNRAAIAYKYIIKDKGVLNSYSCIFESISHLICDETDWSVILKNEAEVNDWFLSVSSYIRYYGAQLSSYGSVLDIISDIGRDRGILDLFMYVPVNGCIPKSLVPIYWSIGSCITDSEARFVGVSVTHDISCSSRGRVPILLKDKVMRDLLKVCDIIDGILRCDPYLYFIYDKIGGGIGDDRKRVVC